MFRRIATLFCLLCGPDRRLQQDTGKCFRPAATPFDSRWIGNPSLNSAGFYAAGQDGAFSRHGLNVNIAPAGEGADTWQLVATGKTEFATSTADQVLIARKQNADVIAIFAVYQTFPQGIMVHQSRGFKSMKDVFAQRRRSAGGG